MFKLPFLNDTLTFPPVEDAHSSGLLAAGGDLSVHRLILAYSRGIFPWFDENDPYLWWSPDPRFVLFTEDFRLSKRQERAIRKANFIITSNQAFDKVIENCAKIPRTRDKSSESGTWITKDMIEAYKELFEEGFAHSVEVWQANCSDISSPFVGEFVGEFERHSFLSQNKQNLSTQNTLNKTCITTQSLSNHDTREYKLVGGLYGVRIGQVFCGESMFHIVPEASRAALAYLVSAMKKNNMPLIDSQQKTDHMARLGAKEIPRKDFLQFLHKGLEKHGTGHDKDFLKSVLI